MGGFGQIDKPAPSPSSVGAVAKAGDTMTGPLVLSGDPTLDLHAATKQYVIAVRDALLNGAGGAYDTLKELADLLVADESTAAALATTVASKLAKASNLADLTDPAAARTALGLGSVATHSIDDLVRSASAGYVQTKQRTSGDLLISSAGVWANLDNGLDLAVNAKAGDMIEVSMGAFLGTENSVFYFDAVTLVSGAPVKSFGARATPDDALLGVAAWLSGAATDRNVSGSTWMAVGAGDISGGQVTIRFRYKTFAATNRTINATAALPLQVFAKNHG